MNTDRLIEGLRTLNAPNQGMSYHAGGARRDGPKYDSHTGERIFPPHEPACLTVYGDRARFLYALIQASAEVVKALQPAGGAGQPSAEGVSAAAQATDDPNPSDQQHPGAVQ